MDNFGWNSPPFIGNNIALSPCIWSHRYDNFSEPVTDYRFVSGEGDLGEALFSSNSDFRGIQECEANLTYDRISEMVEMLSAPTLNSASNNSDLDFLQRQDEIRSASSNSILENSAGSKWVVEAVPSPISSFPPIMPDITNSSSSILREKFGATDEFQLFNHIRNCKDAVLSSIFPASNVLDEVASQGSSNPELNTKRKMEDYYGGAAENSPSCEVLQSSSSTSDGSFQINFENPSKLSKKSRSERQSGSSSIDFRQEGGSYEPDVEAIAQVKEMIYRAAALRPVSTLAVGNAVEKPKRKNVRISSDPQTVAARHRRERISERLRVLQRMVPGGSKMDTASMLDEAANYLKFLKSQVRSLETLGKIPADSMSQSFPMQTLSSFHPLKTLNQGQP